MLAESDTEEDEGDTSVGEGTGTTIRGVDNRRDGLLDFEDVDFFRAGGDSGGGGELMARVVVDVNMNDGKDIWCVFIVGEESSSEEEDDEEDVDKARETEEEEAEV